MAQQRVFAEFSDWMGGESGTSTGKNSPANSFNGTNVVPFIDGSIGPRAGLFDITPTGQANGIIGVVGLVNKDLTPDVFYTQDTHVYQFAVGGARSAAYTGVFASAPTENCDIVSLDADRQHYILVPNDKVYQVNHDTRVVTAIAASPTGRCMERYGTRLVIASPDSLASRIRYSADADPTSWPALNFIDLPGDPQVQIRGLFAMRDYLLIVRRNGELWRLSGVPGVNDTLRRVTSEEPAFTAFQHTRGFVTVDNQFWSIGLTSTAPQVFNGGGQQEISRLGTENSNAGSSSKAWTTSLSENDTLPPEYGMTSPSPDSIVAAGHDRGLMRRHGAWSKHEFGQTVTGWVVHHTNGAIILTDAGGVSTKPNFWWWNTAGEKPPIKGSGVRSRDSVGDGSDTAPSCGFSTPEWWDKQGRRGIVRGVIVDFTEYDTNVSGTNNFGISVTAKEKYAAASETTSAVQPYNAAPALATAAGVNRRIEFGFGDQGMGQGFRINVSDLRGIKINGFQVITDISEGPPV